MLTVNMRKARAQLSRLADRAARGEPFVITKAGKPIVKVTALDEPKLATVKRRGFMAGQIAVPDDFDQMGAVLLRKTFGRGRNRVQAR